MYSGDELCLKLCIDQMNYYDLTTPESTVADVFSADYSSPLGHSLRISVLLYARLGSILVGIQSILSKGLSWLCIEPRGPG